MPSDVEEGPGLLTNADSGRENAFDDSVSVWDDDDAELIEHMGALAAEGCSGVLEPQVAELLSAHQDVAEFYSPPRVLPCARTKGLTGCLSMGPIMWMGLQGEEPTEPFLALVVGPVHHVGHFESSVYDIL